MTGQTERQRGQAERKFTPEFDPPNALTGRQDTLPCAPARTGPHLLLQPSFCDGLHLRGFLLLLLQVLQVLQVLTLLSSITASLPSALAAPFSVLDSYAPSCTLPTSKTINRRWSRWSSPSTWPHGIVPGIGGNRMANATIYCGMRVVLDVPLVQLHTLNIKGWLKLLDSPTLRRIEVKAHYIIVQGYLGVGTTSNPFSHLAIFTLTPNSNGGRAEYLFTERQPADAANPRSLGHKAMAVVGGRVDLHGMPGRTSSPSWVRLLSPATAGAKSITVNADVSAWPRGSYIAIASTSIEFDEAEVAQIKSISKVPTGGYRITLTSPLSYSHRGKGSTRAEVALVSRKIYIQGVDEHAPYEYEGGHFIVYMTRTPQHIEGVQFQLMGQQGSIGKYPLHFHICGDTKGKSVVRKNAIVWSKQRCLVVHATHRLTLEGNVAYETYGHCFVVEEGSERGNIFRSNLGFSTRAVGRLIPSQVAGLQTDNHPATFWMANAANHYFGNVAAGSKDSGFWIEMLNAMRGMSKQLPGIGDDSPKQYGFGVYSGNVAHSSPTGFRTYPHGTADAGMIQNYRMRQGVLSKFLIYSTALGMFLHISRQLTISSSTFIDNWLAIHIKFDSGIVVTGCTFVGKTTPCNADRKLLGTFPQGNSTRTGVHREGRHFFASSYGLSANESGEESGKSGGQELPGILESGITLLSSSSSSSSSTSSLPLVTSPLFPGHSKPRSQSVSSPSSSSSSSSSPHSSPFPSSAFQLVYESELDASSQIASTFHLSSQDPTALPSSSSSSSSSSTSSTSSSSSSSPSSPLFSFESPYHAANAKMGYTSALPTSDSTSASSSTSASVSPSFVPSLFTTAASNQQRHISTPIVISINDSPVGTAVNPVGIAVTQQSARDINSPNYILKSSFSLMSSCNAYSPGILIYTWPYGGFWNPAISTQGLRFGKGTNRIWAVPGGNPYSTTVPSGYRLANYYAIRDSDGSLLGAAGFALAPFAPLLPPPSVKKAKCWQVKKAGPLYGCAGVCYRAPVLWFSENAPTRQSTGLPFSYAVFQRTSDNQRLPAYGSDNEYTGSYGPPEDSPARGLSAPLLAGYTYLVSFQAPDWNPSFYPQSLKIVMQDRGGCRAPLTLTLLPPNSTSQWYIASSNKPTPCSGSRDAAATYYRYGCSNGTPVLTLDVGAMSYDMAAMVGLTKYTPGTCKSSSC